MNFSPRQQQIIAIAGVLSLIGEFIPILPPLFRVLCYVNLLTCIIAIMWNVGSWFD